MATDTALAQLAKQHSARVEELKSQCEIRYKAACQLGETAAASLTQESNARAAQVIANEQIIEAQMKELSQQTEQFQKKMQTWSQQFVKFNAVLKEVGDVAHWSALLEADIAETVSVLQLVASAKRRAVGLEGVAPTGPPSAGGPLSTAGPPSAGPPPSAA